MIPKDLKNSNLALRRKTLTARRDLRKYGFLKYFGRGLRGNPRNGFELEILDLNPICTFQRKVQEVIITRLLQLELWFGHPEMDTISLPHLITKNKAYTRPGQMAQIYT